MKKIIVTTTINPPTEALKKFKSMKGWELIVVGDLKTPHEEYKDYDYLSPEYQKETYPELSELIGWNCIQRRSIGFIEAYKRGADIVATVDDDNIPYDGWGENLLIGREAKIPVYYNGDTNVFDPLSVTNYSHLWHRGFPIQLLQDRDYTKIKSTQFDIAVQADFWNGDPDIDAVCRMEHRPHCSFDEKAFPFTTIDYSPFNSQNTFIARKALPYYFMFPHIGRMDDIWASYFLEYHGFKVAYNKASVYQDRNVQDLTKNFKDEVFGHENTIELLKDVGKIKEFLPEKSWKAYKVYKKCFEEQK